MAAYISGYSNTMDVAGFGFNTQSAMFYQSMHAQLDVHEGIMCDGCQALPLRGIRWKCQSCPDHDICGNCKKAGNSPGHPFEIVFMTTTNNQMANATGQQQTPEAGVHWTTCKDCSAYPIRGTMYACRICPNFELCQNCNTKRMNEGTHQHYFEFFYMPRASDPPPQSVGGGMPQSQPQQAAQQSPAPQASSQILQTNSPPPGAIKLQSATSQQQAVYLIPGTTTIVATNTPIPTATSSLTTGNTNVASAPAVQAPPEEPWIPPSIPQAPFIPRGGLGDHYYHEASYAPRNLEHIPRPTATALETYIAQEDDELSFPQGWQVLVTGFPSRGWWLGEWKGNVGLFPSALVELDAVENHAACGGYWR